MRIMETKVYTYNELSDKAKDRAIEKNRDINTDYKWYESTYDDCGKMMEFLGFSDIDINFSGFSSQGDGACFMGNYRYNPKWKEEFDKEGIIDRQFMEFGTELHDTQAKFAFDLCATIANNGLRYCHENSVSVSVFLNETPYADIDVDAETSIKAICKDIMREIYKRLEADYDYRTSDAAISEALIANEYEFTEEGKMV